jgi:Tfp pilus assembly protein PilF
MGKKHTKLKKAIVPIEHTTIKLQQPSYVHRIQNFLLIWLDGNIDKVNNQDCMNTITKLREVVNTVHTFTNVGECINFIADIKEEKIFIVSSGMFGQTIVPIVHDMPQISTIHIFCRNKTCHEQWAKQWPKVKGVYTDITLICVALKHAAQECDQNTISISFVTPSNGNINQNLDQLDQSFMYTQIMKEILLTIEFDQQHITDFTSYCREQLVGNTKELQNVDKLEREYHEHVPIWWYSYHCFLYSMLNRALWTMDVNLIVNIGFFVRDLHNHISQLHREQYAAHHHLDTFTVYRGQGLSQTVFDQLIKTKGGLFSFNNFLSTSMDRQISLNFARQSISNPDLVSILFEMKIDPSLTSTPFANIKDVSRFQIEKEILFSMHAIFRIGETKQIDENNRLWQVELTLTSDNDPQLFALTERIRQEIFPNEQGWYRLAYLLIKLGQFDKAQEVCETMLDQTSDEHEKANIYDQLAWIKDSQGKYAEAISFYELSNGILQKILSSTHADLATSYNNLGFMYDKMGEYSRALSSHEKALEIYQKILPPKHPDLATSYACHGSVYQKIGDYSKALSFYKKTLEIREENLPPTHPDLAISHSHMGNVYYKMGEYSTALSYYENALNIGQRSLPAHHPNLQLYKKNVERLKNKL